MSKQDIISAGVNGRQAGAGYRTGSSRTALASHSSLFCDRLISALLRDPRSQSGLLITIITIEQVLFSGLLVKLSITDTGCPRELGVGKYSSCRGTTMAQLFPRRYKTTNLLTLSSLCNSD